MFAHHNAAMNKINDAILALGHIKPRLSVRGIAMRVRTNGAHVEQVLSAAGILAGRPVLDESAAVPGLLLARDAAVLRTSADLVARGYRVYLPFNEGPTTGKKIDLLAMDATHTNLLRVVVGGIEDAGQLQRTRPRHDAGVTVAVVMAEASPMSHPWRKQSRSRGGLRGARHHSAVRPRLVIRASCRGLHPVRMLATVRRLRGRGPTEAIPSFRVRGACLLSPRTRSRGRSRPVPGCSA